MNLIIYQYEVVFHTQEDTIFGKRPLCSRKSWCILVPGSVVQSIEISYKSTGGGFTSNEVVFRESSHACPNQAGTVGRHSIILVVAVHHTSCFDPTFH